MLARRVVDVFFLVLCVTTARGENDDACSAGEVGCVRDQGTSLLMMPRNSKSLLPEGEEVDAMVRKSWYGKTAQLKFNYQGQSLEYKLSAFSVYGTSGKASIATSSGKQNIKGASSSFKSTAKGKEATVTFYKDGSVKGLFKHDGQIFKISPSNNPAFLQGKKTGRRSHSVVRVDDSPVHHRSQKTTRDVNMAGNHEPATTISDFLDKVDGPGAMHVGETDHPEVDLAHGPGPDPIWTGTRWFPGCFPGSNQQHVFRISVIGDVQAHIEHGDTLQAQMETAVSEASFIYEQQLNIRLEVAHLIIFTESSTDTPSWALPNCHADDSQVFMQEKLMAIQQEIGMMNVANGASDLTWEGATHIFTGCGDGWGIVGLAFMGGICSPYGINSGINQIRGGDTFLTFAHELGHNFNADHSFEDGQYITGGIMDYGDGILNGAYQFNTKYRKAEMCGKASEVVNNCNGNFAPDPESIPIPTSPPTPAPTLPPLPDGTWEVVVGPCVFEGNGQCITSGNFPRDYGPDEYCEIRVGANFGPVSATSFSTEVGYDILRIVSPSAQQEFQGDVGPQSVIIPVDGSMIWGSDNSVHYGGWRICTDAFIETEDPGNSPTSEPTYGGGGGSPTSEPTGGGGGFPQLPDGHWMVFSGECQINYETGCATSSNYPGNYNNHADCFIGFGANFGSVSARFFDVHESDMLMIGSEFDHESYTGSGAGAGPQHRVMQGGDLWYFMTDDANSAGGWEICRDAGDPTQGPEGYYHYR